MNNNYKILIVEDNHDLIEVMSCLLHNFFKKSVEILNAETFSKATEILDKEEVNLVICDHFLSNTETGGDLLLFLKNKKSKVKFVLCSSFTPEEFPELYPSGSIFFFIQKPEISDGLEHLIHKLESTHNQLSSEVNLDYSDNQINAISQQVDKIFVQEDVPFDRKLISIFSLTHQSLKDNHFIPKSSSLNKTTLQRLVEIQNRIPSTQKFAKEYPEKFQLALAHILLIFSLVKKLDIESIDMDLKLSMLSLLFHKIIQNEDLSEFNTFEVGTINENIIEVSRDQEKTPSSVFTSIFIISLKLSEIYINKSEFRFEEFMKMINETFAYSRYNTEVLNKLNVLFQE